MSKSSIGDRVRSEGMKLGMKAVSKVMEKPEHADKVMKVLSGVQRGREAVDETAAKLLNASQLPSKEDIRQASRHAGRLRRELKKILASIDDIEATLDEKFGQA